MSFTFRPARRENVPLLIGVAGGTGSGKTLSALKLARGLAGDQPFCVIDTESGRAQAYADYFQPWHHGDMTPPFSPAHYAEAITTADAEGYGVIVVDSFSHEHAGDGGLLDMHEAELQRMAGDDWKKREAMKMSGWIRPKSEHKKMVSRLLQLRAHLVVCLRAEEKLEAVKDEKGRTVWQPKRSLIGAEGWVPICEKTLPYELTASFLLTADAPGVPKPIKLNADHRPFVPLDKPLSEETGRALAAWAAGGALAEGEEPKAEVTPGGAPDDASAVSDAAASTAERSSSSANAQALAVRLMELATELGVAEKTADAIAKHADDEPWLERAIVRAQTKLAQEQPGQSAFRIPEAARRD